jgi:hypothetical protein
VCVKVAFRVVKLGVAVKWEADLSQSERRHFKFQTRAPRCACRGCVSRRESQQSQNRKGKSKSQREEG